MWVVRLELASVRLVEVNKKRRNKADLGFLGVSIFFLFFLSFSREASLGTRQEEGAPALLDFLRDFLFHLFFDFGLGPFSRKSSGMPANRYQGKGTRTRDYLRTEVSAVASKRD